MGMKKSPWGMNEVWIKAKSTADWEGNAVQRNECSIMWSAKDGEFFTFY